MNDRKKTLGERLRRPGLLSAPGIYDMVSLRLADTFGFDALYMTGFGAVASHMGLPDSGLATYDATVREKLRLLGIEATPGSAEQFNGEIKRDLARYGQVVKSAGIRIE